MQDANARLAYLTRRKQHKAKREQQKKITALEDRRQVTYCTDTPISFVDLYVVLGIL